MFHTKTQTHQSQCFVKFIDVLLELYTHIPYEIRAEMRTLQNTLVHGSATDLDDYMSILQEKLELKNSYLSKQQSLRKQEQEKYWHRNQTANNLDFLRNSANSQDDSIYPQILILKARNQQPLISSKDSFQTKPKKKNNIPTDFMHDFGKLNFHEGKNNKENDQNTLNDMNQNEGLNKSCGNNNNPNISTASHHLMSIRMPSECSERKLKKLNSSKIKDDIMSRSKSKINITKSCKNLNHLESNEDTIVESKSQYGFKFDNKLQQKQEEKLVLKNSSNCLVSHDERNKFLPTLLQDRRNSLQKEKQYAEEERQITQSNQRKKISKSISMKTLSTKKISTISNTSNNTNTNTYTNNNSNNDNTSSQQTNYKNTLKIVRKNHRLDSKVNKMGCHNKSIKSQANKYYMHSARNQLLKQQVKQKKNVTNVTNVSVDESKSQYIFAGIFKQSIQQICAIMEETEKFYNQEIFNSQIQQQNQEKKKEKAHFEQQQEYPPEEQNKEYSNPKYLSQPGQNIQNSENNQNGMNLDDRPFVNGLKSDQNFLILKNKSQQKINKNIFG